MAAAPAPQPSPTAPPPHLARPDSAMEDDGPDKAPSLTRSLHVSAIQLALKGEDKLLLRLGMTWSAGGDAQVGDALLCDQGEAGRCRAHSIVALRDDAPPDPALFCVFDGHNGAAAAATAADELGAAVAARLPGPPPPSEVAAEATPDAAAAAAAAACSAAAAWRGAVAAALVGAFYDVQVAWAARGAVGGTTATAVLAAGRLVTVANVGDSLAVVDTGAAVLSVCADHRIHNSRREQDRVRAAGGVVSRVAECGVGPAPDAHSGLGPLRVWPGGVANARALGDFDVPPGLLLAAPHVTQVRLPADGGRVIVASDGVWDSLDVHRAAKTARSVAACEAADRVLAAALRATGGVPRDDVSVVVVDVLPRGVPSFAEACGRRLKRSASRKAALAAAGLPDEDVSVSARRPVSPAATPAPRSPPPRGGGLFACCAGPPATVDDDATAHGSDAALRAAFESAASPGTDRSLRGGRDRSVRGGGYGPSVRGGRAFWGATVGSRSPSLDAEAASEKDGSTHSGSAAAGLLSPSPSVPGGVGGSSSKPRIETLLSLDVAVLLGAVPASAADVTQRDAAVATWAPPPFCAALAAAADRAHAMFAKRSGVVTRALPAATDHTRHPARQPTAVDAGGGALRRSGSGPTPVVSVPPLERGASSTALAASLAPSPPRKAAAAARSPPGGPDAVGGGAATAAALERRVHSGRVAK